MFHAKSIILSIAACLCLHQSLAYSCEIYRFEDEQNKAFENHVIKTMTTSMKELCRNACVWLHKCFSINVRPSKIPGFVECDLNNSSKKASPGSLVTRAGSEYHHMGVIDKANSHRFEVKRKEDLGNRWYRYGDAALKVFKDLKTWSEARTHCQSLGGDLASISKKIKNEFIYDVLTKELQNDTDQNRMQESRNAGMQECRKAGMQESRKAGKQESRKAGKMDRRKAGMQESRKAGMMDRRKEGKEGKKERWIEGKKESRKAGMQESRKAGMQERWIEGKKERRKEGKKERRKEGKKERRKEGKKERRKEGKKERRKEGKKERRKEGKKERRKEGKKERRKEGKKERRKEGKKERRKEGKKERRKEGKKERRKEGNVNVVDFWYYNRFRMSGKPTARSYGHALTDIPDHSIAWIGLNRIKGNTFSWSDGRPKDSYTSSMIISRHLTQIASNQKCAATGKRGLWFGKRCVDKKAFICEKPVLE
ncbi:hypothetical protein QZH41_004821 [Actinostola sp. cb2023]|nr:hypothetical protein QZH41_004821 [Actinostola sp. cb2023]